MLEQNGNSVILPDSISMKSTYISKPTLPLSSLARRGLIISEAETRKDLGDEEDRAANDLRYFCFLVHIKVLQNMFPQHITE